MQIFLCIMMFIIGITFGSFLTLAVYRIPLNKDITHERSFCPNCNHKLGFFDLIPIFSYIFLKGKCRYCGKKVRIRYLLLEALSGIVFVLLYLSLNINIYNFDFNKVMYILNFVMFFVTTTIIAGIDKEYQKIDKRVLLFGLISINIFELYLFNLNEEYVLNYLILLILEFIFLFIDTIDLKKKSESKYIVQNILFLIYVLMVIDQNFYGIFLSIFVIAIMISYFSQEIRKDFLAKPDILQELPKIQIQIGYLIGISSIVTVLISNFIMFR